MIRQGAGIRVQHEHLCRQTERDVGREGAHAKGNLVAHSLKVVLRAANEQHDFVEVGDWQFASMMGLDERHHAR
jgi:hypothetical protein